MPGEVLVCQRIGVLTGYTKLLWLAKNFLCPGWHCLPFAILNFAGSLIDVIDMARLAGIFIS